MRTILVATLLALALPAAAQAPPPIATRSSLRSEALREERTFFVWTPPTYGRGAARYPVLYLTDGDVHLLHAIASVEFQSRQGIVPEMIVVAVASPDRLRDFTPSPGDSRGGSERSTAGGADRFLKFLAEELIPYVDRRFRTRPFRVLAGHSLGGLFTVHALESRPEAFGGYVASSPSLAWDRRFPLRRFQELLDAGRPIRASLFVSKGVEEPDAAGAIDALSALVASARPAGLDFAAMDFPDEDHASVVLRAYYHGLRAIFAGWRPSAEVLAGGLPAAKVHYAEISKRIGYEVPVPEYVVNAIGYRHLLREGDAAKALEVFAFGVAAYPRSANAHDSLADAYERSGDLTKAIEHYRRASAIGRETGDPNASVFRAHLDRARAAAAQKR